MHTVKRWKSRNAIEVEEYTGRHGTPGGGRVKRRKPTPEEMRKVNQYNKERRARRKLREHMDTGDYLATLTYQREARPPDMKAAKKDFSRAIAIIRREYKKRGAVLKWMRNIEVGTKGGWHVHLIVNRIQDTDLILKKAWTHGKVVCQLLREDREFASLAAYITKTPDTDPRLKETSYDASRNLQIAEPERKEQKRWQEKIRVPNGFYLDKESLREGINPVTGYRYRSYSLIRIVRKPRKSDRESKRKKGGRTRKYGLREELWK